MTTAAVSKPNGTLTWTEFENYALELCSVSATLEDQWVYRKPKGEPWCAFLEKRVARVMGQGAVAMTTVGDVEDVEKPQLDDFQQVLPTASRVITCEYHIVFSQSYNVPVLYFNMFKPDGSLLTVEEVWSQVPTQFQNELALSKWGAISQQEHPLLGRPYFFIHPCQTEQLMKSCLSSSSSQTRINYLITWLSMFGPIVGLEIPLSYANLVTGVASTSDEKI